MFSGIGAFEKALRNINISYNLVNYCEVDKYASKAYSAIHNETENKNLGDIRKVDIDSLPNVDMITHGSPCQDFSVAGSQKGANEGSGTRSSLMWHTVQIIEKTNPKYVIWENVRNVLSDNHIHNFKKYKEKLRQLGYTNKAKVINAKHWGIPQNRVRIFVVSIRNDINQDFKFPISSLEGQQSLFNDNVIDVSTPHLKELLEDQVKEKYYLSEQYIEELNFDKYNYKHKQPIVRNYEEWRNKKDGIANCLDATYYKYPDNRGARTGVILLLDNPKIRRLTPLECFRLMGFDDKDFYQAKEEGISDTQLYKMAGNSIVVNVLEPIFKSLLKE